MRKKKRDTESHAHISIRHANFPSAPRAWLYVFPGPLVLSRGSINIVQLCFDAPPMSWHKSRDGTARIPRRQSSDFRLVRDTRALWERSSSEDLTAPPGPIAISPRHTQRIKNGQKENEQPQLPQSVRNCSSVPAQASACDKIRQITFRFVRNENNPSNFAIVSYRESLLIQWLSSIRFDDLFIQDHYVNV